MRRSDAIRIRRLRMSDLRNAVEILRSSLPHHPRYKGLTTTEIRSIRFRFSLEKWANRIGQCIRQGSLTCLFTDAYDRVTFVAEESDKLVGVAEAYPLTDEVWLIDSIAVLPNYRRKGIGRQLMHKLISDIREKGGKSVQLYVQPHNVGAMKFYARLGFGMPAQPILMATDLSRSIQQSENRKGEDSDSPAVMHGQTTRL